MSESFDISRRGVLTGAAVFAAATLAPGVVLYASAQEGASAKHRWGILIDTTRCDANCTACVQACNTEHKLVGHNRPATDPQWIRKLTVTDPGSGRTANFPVMCQHCEHPPCVDVCPTGASFIRPDGIVLIDRHTCIGCRYCIMACPYKARSFVHENLEDQSEHSPRGKGTPEGCTMCVHRIDANGTPACVEACSSAGHGSMLFGDLNDPNSDIAKRVAAVTTTQIRADLQTNPAIRYEGI